MSLNEQAHKKKMSIFKQILNIQENLNGVFVQRIMANDVKRLLADPDAEDPVADALSNLGQIFRHCTDELGGDDAVSRRWNPSSRRQLTTRERGKMETGAFFSCGESRF